LNPTQNLTIPNYGACYWVSHWKNINKPLIGFSHLIIDTQPILYDDPWEFYINICGTHMCLRIKFHRYNFFMHPILIWGFNINVLDMCLSPFNIDISSQYLENCTTIFFWCTISSWTLECSPCTLDTSTTWLPCANLRFNV